MKVPYYKDVRENLEALKARGKLHTMKRRINIYTELMPLVRCQYRGLKESERKAFLFEKPVNHKGREYDASVAVALLGASRDVYAIGMKCKTEEILERWVQAQRNPIEPRIINKSNVPVKEEIHVGNKLQEHGGLDEFPIPITTPGFDPAPYFTSASIVTKDPETGVRNVGTYRGMVKDPLKVGIMTHPAQHIGIHWGKCKKMGKPLEAAFVIGTVPSIGMVSVAKIPYGVDEYTVAGGIAGEPIDLVKCETVDLEVPATAELVLEGEITTEYLEPEAPFAEFTGYIGVRAMNPYFEIKCITHRKKPVCQAYISQFPPSESSKIRAISYEAVLYKLLKYDCNIPSILDVAFHESSGSWEYCVIQMKKQNQSQPWQALNATVALDPTIGKIIIAVDDDVDPGNEWMVNWALSFRMQPHLDVRIVTGKSSMLDPSAAPPDASTEEQRFPKPSGTSAILIDATRKWDYPPTALPKKEYMDKGKELWEEEGLPKLELTPGQPWSGYSLGSWSKENEEEAELAVKGEFYKTGEKLAGRKQKI